MRLTTAQQNVEAAQARISAIVERIRIGEDPREYIPVSCPNIDEFLFLPVALGYWKQHELWDGTYTLDDLLDIAELAEVRRENETRAMEVKEYG